MKKLLAGILEFREKVRPQYREQFAHLALEQRPDCLFVGCADSRVVPNIFASTQPGDLFVVRNVGNLVPPAGAPEAAAGAAVEFAVNRLGVHDIVVCGHSECGAMRGILQGGPADGLPHLDAWLAVGRRSLHRLAKGPSLDTHRPAHDQLSQHNVLQQIEHLSTFPEVAARVAAGTLRLHGWWFDLAAAEVLAYDAAVGQFQPITSPMSPPVPI